MDVDALKNVLAHLDLVALLLRNRPPLPTDAKVAKRASCQTAASTARGSAASATNVLIVRGLGRRVGCVLRLSQTMREEVSNLLARSTIRMNNRELSVLCILLRQQQADTGKRATHGLDGLTTM